MAYLRIIGDVHGKVHQYLKSVQNCEYSIQIGDLGFDYEPLKLLAPDKHKFVGGNHDNYDTYYKCPNSLGDFGSFALGGLLFYTIRGEHSIDFQQRKVAESRGHSKCWWHEEQLSLKKMYLAFDDYKSKKPDTMISHTCPKDISKMIGKPDVLRMFGYDPDTYTTPTQELLQECFEYHQPKVWIFGHFHRDWSMVYNGTLFICLGELQYIDVDKLGRSSKCEIIGA